MAGGYGCYRKGKCPQYSKQSAKWRRDYCDSDTNCKKCQFRWENENNIQYQKIGENHRRNESDTGLGWFIIIVVVVLVVIGKFFI